MRTKAGRSGRHGGEAAPVQVNPENRQTGAAIAAHDVIEAGGGLLAPIRTPCHTARELLRTIARIAGLRPVLMRMPFALWDALAGLAEMLPGPPLTRSQVELMQIDTTTSEKLPGFRALGISPRTLEDELEAILRQNKPRISRT